MNLENDTSFILRYGSMIGVIIVLAGLLIHLADMPHDLTVMTAGILTIIFTPFAGMIVSFVTLSANKERRYAMAALALIIITMLGMLIAFHIS